MKDTIKNGEVLNGFAANLSIEINKKDTFLIIKIPFCELEIAMEYGRNAIRNLDAFKRTADLIDILE